MCKHVAAVLYGIGNRLDSEPALFFTLRNIDFKELLKKSMEEKRQNMLKNAERQGLKQRIAEMQEFLAKQMDQIEEYDESLVRRMVEKVTVYEEKFMVEFKSSTSVDVER